MIRFIVFPIIFGLLAGCSLDASLLMDSTLKPDQPSTPDNPSPIVREAVQVQKLSFDFHLKRPIGFAAKMAGTPDGNFLFLTADSAKETFPFTTANENSPGALIVYRKSGGTFVQHQILRHPIASMSFFASSVGASNEWLVVGTLMDNLMEDNSTADATNSGSAILYKWNATTSLWEYSQKLKAPAGSRYQTMTFGSTFALDGSHLAVYAGRADNVNYDTGAVFMYGFDGSNWQFAQKITAAVPVGYRYFGNNPVFDSGKLYLAEKDNGIPGRIDTFEYDGSLWNKTSSATTALATGSECASSFAVQGDLMAMGCPSAYDDDGNLITGQVNIFKYNGTNWVDIATISEASAPESGSFGLAVSLSGNKLYVSGGFEIYSGKIIKFEIDGSGAATEVKKILPERQVYVQNFGSKTMIRNNILFANQTLPDKISDVPGAVRLYDISTEADTYLTSIGLTGLPVRSLSTNAKFGESLAVTANGANVVIGSPGNPYQEEYPSSGAISSKPQLGSAQFYKRTSDKTLQALGARSYSDTNRRDTNMLFGQTVSVSNSIAAVGSPGGMQWFDPPVSGVRPSGHVSVTTADLQDNLITWGIQLKVMPSDDADSIDSLFGSALKLNGANLIVGAPEHKLTSGSKYGKVFIYYLHNMVWSSSPVTALDADAFKTADMRFGASVDFSNGILAVGAPGAAQTPAENAAANGGGVWIYNYDGTTTTLLNILMGDQIYAADGSPHSTGNINTWQAGDKFGSSVLVSGTQLFISSPGANSGAGAVFVYGFNAVAGSYEFIERLDMTLHSGQTATPNAAFGTSMVLAEDLLVVGAPGENLDRDGTNSITEAGAVFILKNAGNGFKGYKKVTPTGPGARTAQSRFGQSIAYAANSLYVGSPGHDLDESGANSVTGAGAIFVFDISGLVSP